MSSLPQQINAREVSTSAFDLTGKRVFVAGHTGMAGSAIMRRLQQEACTVLVAERRELDLNGRKLVTASKGKAAYRAARIPIIGTAGDGDGRAGLLPGADRLVPRTEMGSRRALISSAAIPETQV